MNKSLVEKLSIKPTGPRSEVETRGDLVSGFTTASHQEGFRSVQAKLLDLPKKDAVDFLGSEFPHKSRSWFERNLKYLMSMDFDDFYEMFNHQDPTAKKAIRNLSRRNTTNGASPTRLAFSI